MRIVQSGAHADGGRPRRAVDGQLLGRRLHLVDAEQQAAGEDLAGLGGDDAGGGVAVERDPEVQLQVPRGAVQGGLGDAHLRRRLGEGMGARDHHMTAGLAAGDAEGLAQDVGLVVRDADLGQGVFDVLEEPPGPVEVLGAERRGIGAGRAPLQQLAADVGR
jgi:hypothetical protein